MMSALTADAAVSAAGAALWRWDAAADRIFIRAESVGTLTRLDGTWSRHAFLAELDGLSRNAVAAALAGGTAGAVVDLTVALKSGQSARLVGSFSDVGLARGLMTSAAAVVVAPVGDSNVEPVFQPIRRLGDFEVIGFEALARFRSSEGRLVGADALSERGEEPDWVAIAPVMLRRSAEVLARLRAGGRRVVMQVNLSAAELARPDLIDLTAAIIRDADLPPGALRIELTEQAALRDYEAALGALSALRAAGAGIVLDDFGGGHSSFAWLAELPADGVKLDPKLSRIAMQPRGGRIVSALTGLIRSLGMTVTAEGIEDERAACELEAIGCDSVQGFAWDMPLRAQDVEAAFEPHPAGKPA